MCGVFGVTEFLPVDEFVVPKGVQVGVVPKPFDFDFVAAEVVGTSHVHGAVYVAYDVDEESQRYRVVRILTQAVGQVVDAIDGFAAVLAHGETVERGAVEAGLEVVVVPRRAGAIGGVAFDEIAPVGFHCDGRSAQHGDYLFFGFFGQVLLRYFADDAMPFESPSVGAHGQQCARNDDEFFHGVLSFFC